MTGEACRCVYPDKCFCSEAALECLDMGNPDDDCDGAVEYRMSLSPTGRSFPRCDHHWQARLDLEEETTRKYGHWNSDVPPPGFDPLDAGERWDDEY